MHLWPVSISAPIPMFKIISPFSPVVLKAEIQSYHSVEIADGWGCSVLGCWWWKETFKAANQASVQISTQTNILCLQIWDWAFLRYIFNITYYYFCPELGGKGAVTEKGKTIMYIYRYLKSRGSCCSDLGHLLSWRRFSFLPKKWWHHLADRSVL